MLSRTSRIRTIYTAVLLGVAIITSLACSIGGLTIGKGNATLDVTLNQEQVNTIFKNIPIEDISSDSLLKQITQVEMHEGYLRIFGKGTAPNGQEFTGSFDVALSAENNVLQAKITAVDIPGVTLDDPRIVEANQVMAKELSKSVTESKGDVQFKDVQVREGEIQLKLQVDFNQNI